ncbi:MAG TPA: aminotransferase class I/II-fold pyridoxal phosphate-dependent enzyme [Thermoanaerobaculia bacterium]|jgi:histidinol-phosphate aminotransferase|nr:aminotransferase class I/II-fold pyridoxal phosphate-dependent enzyme [Thermoanaerobaculia bacterium]
MIRPIDPVSLVRPEFRRMSAYHLDLTPCRHKLDQNEVPWDLPRRIKLAVTEGLMAADWARYPDFHGDDLRRDLGRLHNWPWEGILVGNGSNELLATALEALVAPGTEVIGAEPSFGLYRMFVMRSGGVPRFLLRPDLRRPALVMDEIEAEVERNPRRPVLLCTPNNPTGDALPPEWVAALLERLEGPLLLDNAYGEFSRFDYRPLLARYPHLLLFRTFSKAWSLAGMRLGYLMARPALVAELIKVKLPYNLGHAAILAGRAVLAEEEEARRRVRVIVARRAQWTRMLAEEGFEVFPSEANFLLIRCESPDKARQVRDGLAARGIRIRDVGHYAGLANCLRVSVGSGMALRETHLALEEIREGVPVAETRLNTEPLTPRPPLPQGERGGPASDDEVEQEEMAFDSELPSPVPGEGPGVRASRVERSTKETTIRLALNLDGGPRSIDVPNGFFGHMLEALATHGGLGLDLEAEGDTQVDLHHTVEDVGIALGEALASALGDRRGIVRFAHAYAPLDEALARAVVDLSGRGSFAWNAPREVAAGWVTADFPLTLVADFFQAFADRGRLTLHLDVLSARNGHHAAEAAFKAAALAIRAAVAIRAGFSEVPSTKGTLSV